MPANHLRLAAGRLAPRRRDRLRRLRQPQDGRLQAVRPAAAPTAAAPGSRSPATCPQRGTVYAVVEDPQDQEPPLRRHRVRPLLHPRRRQEVDSAQGRPADHPGARPRHPGARRRPRPRDLRPRLLHPRRPRAAARPRRREARRRGDPVPRRQGPALRPRLAHRRPREGLPRRDLLHRRQPAVRRHLHLVPEGRAQDQERDARRGREEGARGEARHRLSDARHAARRDRGGGRRRRAHRCRRPGSDRPPARDQAGQGDAAPDLGPALSGGRSGGEESSPRRRSRRRRRARSRPPAVTAPASSRASAATPKLLGEVDFEVEALANATLPAKDRAAVLAFQRRPPASSAPCSAPSAWSASSRSDSRCCASRSTRRRPPELPADRDAGARRRGCAPSSSS